MPYDHLSPETAELADRPVEERIGILWHECWIGYPRAMTILDHLNLLIRMPQRLRTPHMLLSGQTNNGKSTLIKRFLLDHAATISPDGTHEIFPAIYFETPTCDAKRFYACLLRTLNSKLPMTRSVAAMEDEALRLLSEVGTRMLIVDEIHNILTGRRDQIRMFLNLLRFLGNTLKIPIVIVGISEAAQVMRSDDQSANRFEPFYLPTWTDGEEYLTLLDSFEAVLPLRIPSDLSNPLLARKILAMSEGILGEISTVLSRAAELAIREGKERIDTKLLGRITFTIPSRRRHGPRDAA